MTPTLGQLATQVRSKNAGPFWMTIDAFFDDDEAFERASRSAITDRDAVGRLYSADPEFIRVFLLPLLRAIKVSLPRPVVQGSLGDRDMHAGQQYVPLLGFPMSD